MVSLNVIGTVARVSSTRELVSVVAENMFRYMSVKIRQGENIDEKLFRDLLDTLKWGGHSRQGRSSSSMFGLLLVCSEATIANTLDRYVDDETVNEVIAEFE